MNFKINYILFLITLFSSLNSYSQSFGGGSGTVNAPYQIWNIEQWNYFTSEHGVNPNINSTNIHFRLMADIGPITSYLYLNFKGYFHGGGHKIDVSGIRGNISVFSNCHNCTIDSVELWGATKGWFINFIKSANNALISNCTSNIDVGHLGGNTENKIEGYGRAFIAGQPGGYFQNLKIISCINKSSVYVNCDCQNIANQPFSIAGIATNYASRGCTIINCKNYGHLRMKANGQNKIVAGIFAGACTYMADTIIIENCANYGNLRSGGSACGIIVDVNSQPRRIYKISNCVNIGNITIDTTCNDTIISDLLIFRNAQAIGNIFTRSNNISYIKNCLNLGNIYSYKQFPKELSSFIAIDSADYRRRQPVISNCLNVGRFYNVDNHIFANHAAGIPYNNAIINYNVHESCLKDNLYDKQRSPYIINNTPIGLEAWLTKDLIGNSQSLREKLGNGWSYAQNRYPVPRGFENDSIVLLYATPINLYSENNEIYNHVDSVTNNFNLATTINNSIEINWSSLKNKIYINNESAILFELGSEVIISKLGYYENKIDISIKDTESKSKNYLQTEIYPNPANDFIYIYNIKPNTQISITNTLGQTLINHNSNSNNTMIELSNLPSGIYIISIKDEIKINKHKIIKNN